MNLQRISYSGNLIKLSPNFVIFSATWSIKFGEWNEATESDLMNAQGVYQIFLVFKGVFIKKCSDTEKQVFSFTF